LKYHLRVHFYVDTFIELDLQGPCRYLNKEAFTSLDLAQSDKGRVHLQLVFPMRDVPIIFPGCDIVMGTREIIGGGRYFLVMDNDRLRKSQKWHTALYPTIHWRVGGTRQQN
jgi:hypothetical protein